MHIRYFFFACTVLFAVLVSAPLGAQKKRVIPEALAAAIKGFAPTATLVEAREVDAAACAPVGEEPGLVRADFDGDGFDDYAVLLKTKETGKETFWEGRKLREAHFAFVLFLSHGSDEYKPLLVRRYVDFVPTAVVLDLRSSGDVRHRETRKPVKLRNPGVTLSFCEKSATTYFLLDGKVLSVPVAD
jgi:hypothetical protein